VYPLTDGPAHFFRPVRRYPHADLLRAGGSQPSVHSGLCGSVWVGFPVRVPARRVALWIGRGDLGRRSCVALARGEDGWVVRQVAFNIGDTAAPAAARYGTQPVIGTCYSNLKNSSREIIDCLRMSRTSRSGKSPGCTETVVRRVGSLPCTKLVMRALRSLDHNTCTLERREHLSRSDLRQPAHTRANRTGITSLTVLSGSASNAGIGLPSSW
jgi:hypothetical protein